MTAATWAKKASESFKEAGIYFVDCPVSGGPARAREGKLTMIASGDDDSLNKAKDVLDALASELHIIKGGPGAGSTVKCVHQLLAGVHICAAAEAIGTYRSNVIYCNEILDACSQRSSYSHGGKSGH